MSTYPDDEPATTPINQAVLMTMPQVREALDAIPVDFAPLVRAIARSTFDAGYLTGVVKGSRVCPIDQPKAAEPKAPQKKKR